jgi:uncharacterized SAM-binding protein YcdF (DUF218 family)
VGGGRPVAGSRDAFVTVDFLREHARIDSPTLVVGVLLLVVIWLWRRPEARGPRRLLCAYVAVYWFLATWTGATLLTFGVAHGLAPLAGAESARGADTVVVLGGGANTFGQSGAVVGLLTSGSVLRALEAARVFKAIDARLVIVSGGIPHPGFQLAPESELLRDALIKAGVPADRIVQDPDARTTREHPRTLGPILQSHHVGRFVLVTSPTHMRRALAVFHAAGFDPVPSVALLRPENRPSPRWLVPSDESLYQSGQAIYEYAARVYYRFNGWN